MTSGFVALWIPGFTRALTADNTSARSLGFRLLG